MTDTATKTDLTVVATAVVATAAPTLPLTMPTAPRKINLSFSLLELSDKIKTASDNVATESNITECLKRQRRALLTDESYDAPAKIQHNIYGPMGTLTTAREFLSVWESGLIYVETRRHPDMRDLGGVEVLRFNPDHSGQSFNVAHSHDYVMHTPVFKAIKLALDHGWRGETEQVISNRLRAARERLEILKESLPSSETIAAVEAYVRAIYQYLAARVESITAPLAEALAAPIDITAPLPLGFLSALSGLDTELADAGAIARRWMLPTEEGKAISASLASMRDQLAGVAKSLQSRAEEIHSRAQQLGR